MDCNMMVRVEQQLKDDFKEAAEKLNPQLPKNKAVSVVIRQLMVDYVNDYKKGDKK